MSVTVSCTGSVIGSICGRGSNSETDAKSEVSKSGSKKWSMPFVFLQESYVSSETNYSSCFGQSYSEKNI